VVSLSSASDRTLSSLLLAFHPNGPF